MKRFSKRGVLIGTAFFLLAQLTACSSTQYINLKIHTEPEGAHIIYRLDDNRWTYLGVTPLDTMEIMDEEQLEGNHSLTLKAMRCGYLDQAKEWHGEDLLLENDAKGMIFWTPRLIKNIE